jgi:hypothetical protein
MRVALTPLRFAAKEPAGPGQGLSGVYFLGEKKNLSFFVFFFPFHFLRQINLKKESLTAGPPPILSFRKGVPGPTNPLPSFFFYMD